MATPMQGSASGTLQGQNVRPTEMERLAAEGARMAQQLLTQYTAPPTPTDTSRVEQTFAPLQAEIAATPPPAPVEVPSAPSGLGLLSGLFATSVAGSILRDPQVRQEGLNTAKGRIEGAEAARNFNIAQRNKADQERNTALLAMREKILTTKLQQELANEEAAKADKTTKELFIVKTALDHIASEVKFQQEQSMTREELQARERIGKHSDLMGFLGQLVPKGGSDASGGMTIEAEANEIAKLVDFTNTIDLKLQPETGMYGFGRKMPSEEELNAMMGTSQSYLSSPSQRVRASAVYYINNTLQARFGDDQKKKLEYLQKVGLAPKE